MKAVAKRSFKEREKRIIQRAIVAHNRFRQRVENNELIEITRVYPDGRREKLKVPGHELMKNQIDPAPLNEKETKKTREALGMTQEAFARWLMVSVATVRNWEQKTGVPRGPALRLIHELTRNGKKPHSFGL